MRKIKSENLVIKSNQLVEAKYRLTTTEQRIIYKLITLIKKDDSEFKTYSIKIKDMLELVDTKSKNMYSHIKSITRNLQKKIFTIYDLKRNEELQVSWLSSVLYKYGEGVVELEVSNKLKPYLLQLKKAFTKFDIKQVIKLKSTYSCRIYEFLKQYEKIGERIMQVHDLKSKLDIINEYKLYTNFKQKVILQAQKEINEKTDIKFDFEEIKDGRKVVSIKFIIKSQDISNNLQFKDCVQKDNPNKKDDKNIQIADNARTIIEQFKIKYNGNLDYNLVKNLIKSKGIETINLCFDEFNNYITSAKEVEKVFFTFCKTWGTDEQFKKNTSCTNNNVGGRMKPVQATNYEQRKYEDSFFDSLYENVKFIKK